MTNHAPYDTNRVATFKPTDNGKFDHDRELVRTFVFVAPDSRFDSQDEYYKDSRYTAAITIRVTMARSSQASNVYAGIQASSRDKKIWLSGNGKAVGCGYDKESAAIDDAFHSAGIIMESSFSGCGERPIKHAIKALAKRLGWNTGQVMTF